MAGFTSNETHQLQLIQRKVFSGFTYVTDMEKHGLVEKWENLKPAAAEAPAGFKVEGDCEEFAMFCMLKVREVGFNVRLVLCTTERGDGHLVAEVISADGKQSLFFDNRNKTLRGRSTMHGYTFLRVSPVNPVPKDTRRWRLVR